MGFHGMRREDLNEGQLQNQSSWVPVTPAKPTPARPQLDHVERQGNPLVQTNCFQSVGFPTGYMQQPSSTEGVMLCFSPMGSMEENTSPYNRQGALSGENRAANHIVGSSGQSLTDTAAGWNNLTFIDLLAMTNEASASSGTAMPQNVNMATSSIYPPSCHAINNGCTVQNYGSLIENKDRSAHSNPWSNKYPARLTTYGFPVPYQPTRELNSTPQTIAAAATNSTISFQHTQGADQTQEKQNNQLSELINLVGYKRSLREKDKQEDPVAPIGTEVIMLQCDEHSSQPAVESSSTAIFTSMEEVSNRQKEGDHGTDLNKTPQQKPRRKKHRPKVITEGKAKRTPKPLTPKCTDSKGKSGKRKYVRRNNLKTSATPSTDAIDGRINPIPVPAVKSCKRTLNFDLERQNGEEDHAIKASYQKWLQDSIFNRSSCSSVYYLNSESDKSCPKVTTVDQGQGTEIVVEKTQADRQASITYGPTPSEFQILTDYASLRENHAAKKPQCMMKSTSTENVKVLAMDTNDGTADASCCIDNKEDGCRATYQQFHVMGSGQVALPEKAAIKNHQGGVDLQRGPRKRQTKKNDPKCRNNKHFSMVKQTRGSKREYCHTTDQTEYSCTTHCWSQGIEETRLAERHIHTMNPAEAHNFWESYHKRTHVNGGHNHSSNFAPHISDMYKKQRTEQENITSASAMLSSISTLEDCSSRATECSGNHANKSYCESQVITCGIPASHFYTVSIPKKLKNAISEPKHDLNAFSVTSTCNSVKTKSSLGLISCTEAESCSAPGNLQLSQYLLTLDHTNSMTKKKFKGFTQACNLAPPITAEYNQLPQNSPKQTQVYSPRQRNEIFHRPQACMEALIADNTAKMTTDEHRNEPSQVSSVFRSSANEVHLQENEKFNCEYTQSSKFMESSRNPFDLLINSNYDHLSNSNGLCEAGTKEVTGKNMVPMDEVIQRLKLLDLSGGDNNISHENYNALVPYGRKGTMVPYEGPFYPTRKRRQRPKVDLDPETNRLWKLLMGKEGSEGTDKDKEKWWEDERQVLQQRAESFIARMHLVQGDRRFSQWKGSVVDSVIGVFLTQNVSDHLSSSAFMSLAARFPLNSTGNHTTSNEEISTSSTLVKDPEVSIPDSEEFMLNQQAYDQCSMTLQETNHIEESEVVNSQESFGSNMGSLNTEMSKCKQLVLRESKLKRSNELQGKTDTFTVGTGITSLVEPEDRSVEDAASSQDFEDSLVVQTTERNGSCSDSNSEGEDQTIVCKTKHIDGSTSFMELLQMAGTSTFKEIYTYGTWNLSHNDSSSNEPKQSEYMSYVQHQPSSNSLHLVTNSSAFIHLSNSQQPKKQVQIIPSDNYCLNTTPDLGRLELKFLDVRREENRSLPPSMSNIIKLNGSINNQNELAGETTSESISQERVPSRAQEAPSVDPSASLKRHHIYPLCRSQPDGKAEINLNSDTNHEEEMNNAFHLEGIQFGESSQNSRMQQASNLPIFSGKCLEIESGTLFDKNKPVESNTEGQAYQSGTTLSWVNTNNQVKGKVAQKKNNGFDWDSLRREVYANGKKQEKCVDAMDSVDWEAVRCADVNEISNAIRERGMNNMLAERIKDFLNRLAREHGSIDLEWLMDIPPQNAKEYLLSVWGLGLKSVECVRLLRLHHIAFPVDTNVGRIAVRLGWVPLQPLPESLQLHLLELYPMLEAVQKYLWPRLCTLDQRTLYELHYQMITFGKVFCTKNKPNCNACPMRTECKHFASAFASARLALPGPEEKSIVSSNVPIVAEQEAVPGTIPMPLPLLEAEPLTEARPEIEICEPIIEVPATPEPESTEITLGDIEDAFYEDPDEIPTIKLNVEEFTLNLQNYMQENNMGLQEHDLSKALVALTPEATSIPMPKLKNVSRLRTEHQVYELPDSHPLLKGLDRREPGDPCSYLLAIWLPGETANSIQPPKNICDSQVSGQLCNEKTCFSCNSIREENSKTVRGTLLIPCRTALRGSFPLNGTYFQVNEVFADHESSLNPIYIPREWIWNLPRRTVYFGTSVTSIFKGLSTEEIQYCFWRGFVCVRGFEQKTRAPRPLIARLHVAASKLAKSKT